MLNLDLSQNQWPKVKSIELCHRDFSRLLTGISGKGWELLNRAAELPGCERVKVDIIGDSVAPIPTGAIG